MAGGGWEPHVPAVTIGRPGIPKTVVRRPGLIDSLRHVRDDTLVVVSAPAGYGKTTSMTLWDEADERPFAWVRLDHLDDDPAHLLLHIATALDRVRPLDSALLQYLRGPSRSPQTQLAPVVIGALEACGSIVVVLDDTHELTAPDAVEMLSTLVGTTPTTSTMVLSGRHVPPLDLARRRLQHRVVEVGTDELKLTAAEATEVFLTVGGSTDHGVVASVVDKCEGWAAGVLLASLALRDGADVATLTGRHRLVSEYLVAEVLDQLDDSIVTFLTESSVLERFCAKLLDGLLGRRDSADMLEKIVRSGNHFLISLDAERVWYRYHRMFGDLLRARLRDRDPIRFRLLAKQAADLLAASGDVDGALRQAIAAGDHAQAADLVGRDAARLGFDGRAGVLARRLGQLDEQTFAVFPDAAIARAWLGLTTGDAELIHSSLALAVRADRGQPMADGSPSVTATAALIEAAVGMGGIQKVVEHADVVLAQGGHLTNPWWGAANTVKGGALSMLGETAHARQLLEPAVLATAEFPGIHAAAQAHLALLDLDEGDWGAATTNAAAARAIADEHDLCDVVPMIVVYGVDALVNARLGNVDAARAAAAATERLLAGLGFLAARTALLGHVLLARAAVDLDDRVLLRRHLDSADRARKREPGAAGLIRRLDEVRTLTEVVPGQPALTKAEQRLLPYLATHLSLQRIAEDLTIGRETAKSQATSIYRKLAVSSRAAAVAEAERLGLFKR